MRICLTLRILVLTCAVALLVESPTPAYAAASANDATITTAGQTLTDASGNVWTFNAAAMVTENGALASVSGNVVEMAYVNGVVYHKNTSGQWWQWTGRTWTGPVGDPLPVTASASGSTVTVAGQTLTDSSGNVWTFNTAAKVTVNGMLASVSGNVIEMAYVNGTVYHENTSGQWWKWMGSTWTGPVGDPLPFTPSASGSTVTVAGQTLTDSNGNVWTFNAAAKVTENGMLASVSGNVVEVAYVNGTIYHKNTSGQWWKWIGTTWIGPVANPLPVTLAACTDSAGTSHASGSSYTLTISTTQGSTTATTAQCPYGGTQPTTTTVTQTYLCTNGTATAQGTSVTNIVNTGNPTCNAAPINGVCGTASGGSYLNAPTSGLCATGTASSVTLSGSTWGWSCTGANNGTNASCSAAKLAVSASGTTVTTAGAIITDASGNTWNFTASGLVDENGALAPGGSAGVVEMAYVGGVIYQKNSAGQWWKWTGAAPGYWTGPVANPLPATNPTNGACGSSNGADLTAAPTTNLCTTGTASSVTGSGTSASPWSWTCPGTNGGSTANCTALLKTNGAVGSAKGGDFTTLTASSANLCAAGTVTAFAITSTGWTWSCAGTNGGTTDTSGIAYLTTNGACGTSNGADLTSIPTTNLCATGTASSVTGSGNPWSWTCPGTNGGTTANCTALLEINGVCGTANNSSSLNAPTSNLCATGTASSVTLSGSTWGWNCLGANNGTNASCSAAKLTVSASGAVITTAGATLVDASGNVWNFTSGGLVDENGALAPGGSAGVVEMAYVGGAIYQKNGLGNWYQWVGAPYYWTPTSNPLPVNGACGSANGGNVSSLNANSANLCATGSTVASFTSTSGGWSWNCDGTGGGSSASCAASNSALVPIIFNYQQAAKPGDIIYLQGANLSNAQVNLVGYGNLEVLSNSYQASEMSVQLPANVTGALNIYVTNASGSSPLLHLNQAQPYNLDATQIAPGAPFRLFGRNLLLGGSTPTVKINGQTATLNLASSTETMLVGTVPTGLAAGAATITADNGNGSGANTILESVTIIAGSSADPFGLGVGWASAFANIAAVTIDATSDPHVSPHMIADGVTDNTNALQAAINYANSIGGGTVVIPAGTYVIASNYQTTNFPVLMKSNVVIKGAGKGVTVLNYTAPSQFPLYAGNIDLAGVTDLTLSTTVDQQAPIFAQNTRFFLKNIAVSFGVSNQLYMDENTNIAVEDSDFSQLGLGVNGQGMIYAGSNTGLVMTGNIFQYQTGAAFAIAQTTDSYIGQNTIIRDGSVQNEQPYGGTHGIPMDFMRRVTIDSNSFQVINGPITNYSRNDGEALLAEGGGPDRTESEGSVTAATATTLTDANNTLNLSNSFGFTEAYSVIIIAGTGVGQRRDVVSYTTNTLTVDHPWDVIPDTTSLYMTVIASLENIIISNNSFNECPRGTWIYDATADTVDIINNSYTNGGGILINPYENGSGTQESHDVDMNINVVGNSVTNTTEIWQSYIDLLFTVFVNNSPRGLAGVGIVFKNNILVANSANLSPGVADITDIYEGYADSIVYQTAGGSYNPPATPAFIGTIFQGDSCTNCATPVTSGTDVYGSVYDQMTLTNSSAELLNEPTNSYFIVPGQPGSQADIIEY